MSQQPVKKTSPGERMWPYRQATVRGWNGNNLKVVFNKDQKCFDGDVIMLEIEGVQAYVSRDDLGEVLINGYAETKAYRDELEREGRDLKKQGVL